MYLGVHAQLQSPDTCKAVMTLLHEASADLPDPKQTSGDEKGIVIHAHVSLPCEGWVPVAQLYEG